MPAVKLPRRLIRDIAHEFQLRHSEECRDRNGKGRGFMCRCDFFERVERHIIEKFRADWTTTRLEQMRRGLESLLTQRDVLMETLRGDNQKLSVLDQKIGDFKIEVAVGEVVLGERAVNAMTCEACRALVKTLEGGREASGIVCTGCSRTFCDNCYDTGKGDGCHCHPVCC